jgi:hypothetical protein
VSLLIPADSVQVGSPTAPPQPAEEKPQVSVWGSADLPDPREKIPGWKPEKLGAQVAGNLAGRSA